jgi:hypothetical protein
VRAATFASPLWRALHDPWRRAVKYAQCDWIEFGHGDWPIRWQFSQGFTEITVEDCAEPDRVSSLHLYRVKPDDHSHSRTSELHAWHHLTGEAEDLGCLYLVQVLTPPEASVV